MKTYNLERFVKAQERDYHTALNEMKAGRKVSHWIWYIFPQLKELGRSGTAKFYGIDDIDEARAYLEHPVLGQRLREICEVILKHESSEANHLMGGHPDDYKLRSCMTLFAQVSDEGSVFHRVLDKYFDSNMDEETLSILRRYSS